MAVTMLVHDMGDLCQRVLGVLVDAGVKGFVLLAVAGAVTFALRRGSAAARHLVWTAAMGGLLLLVGASFVVPKWRLPVVPPLFAATRELARNVPAAVDAVQEKAAPVGTEADSELRVVTGQEPTAAAPTAQKAGTGTALQLPLAVWAIALWLAGVAVVLLRLARGFAAVNRMVRKAGIYNDEHWKSLAASAAADIGLTRSVRVLRVQRAATPMAVGLVRSSILLPREAEEWDGEKSREVLLHELAHVKRGDCLTQALANLACAVHWFNPLAWMALRRLRIEREGACDDCVLAAGARASLYAGNLLEIATTTDSPTLAAAAGVTMARKGHLEGRLQAILDATRNRGSVTRNTVAAALILMAIIIPVVAAVDVSAQVKEAEQTGGDETLGVVWSLVADEPLVTALKAGSTELPGAATQYEAYRMPADRLLETLQQGEAKRQVLGVGCQMGWLEVDEKHSFERALPFGGYGPVEDEVGEGLRRSTTLIIQGSYTVSYEGAGLKLKLDGNAQAYLNHWGTKAQGSTGAQVRRKFVFSGSVEPGNAVVFLAPMGKELNLTPWHVIITQAVRVAEPDAPYVLAYNNAPQWLDGGLDWVLGEIRKAQKWQKAAEAVSERDESRWSVTTPLGGTIRLVAIGYPVRWPYRWWDGDGRPIAGEPGWEKATAKQEFAIIMERKGVDGMVDYDVNGLTEPGDNLGFGMTGPADRGKEGASRLAIYVTADSRNDVGLIRRRLSERPPVAVTVTYGAGPWRKVADIAEGQTVVAEGGRFYLKSVTTGLPKSKTYPGSVTVDGEYDYDTSYEVTIVGADAQGTRSRVWDSDGSGQYGRREGRRIFTNIQMDKGDIDHFEILVRPTETHTFSGIATEPAAGGAGD